jgi:hypothetical protein
VLSEAHDLYHRFGDLPFEDRRAIVEAIVERITIGGEEIELALAALPPFPMLTAFGQRTPGVVGISCHDRAGGGPLEVLAHHRGRRQVGQRILEGHERQLLLDPALLFRMVRARQPVGQVEEALPFLHQSAPGCTITS